MKLENPNLKLETDEVISRARHIKLLLMDCDGVLTDGRLWLTADGEEQKSFHVRDGQGIVQLHAAGLKTGIISGRTSSALERRAQELQISFVRQNISDKLGTLNELLSEASVSSDQCAFMGDDLGDIPIMRRVGLAVAVANAAEETKRFAHYITKQEGGAGAVREVCELILKAQGRWAELMRKYSVES